MQSSEYEWDDAKAAANLRRHGISFNEAASVLAHPLALTLYDEKHSIDEDRFLTIGYSDRSRMLLVVHCERGIKVRIISARRANAAEKTIYDSR